MGGEQAGNDVRGRPVARLEHRNIGWSRPHRCEEFQTDMADGAGGGTPGILPSTAGTPTVSWRHGVLSGARCRRRPVPEGCRPDPGSRRNGPPAR
jgi:hypothetical protein